MLSPWLIDTPHKHTYKKLTQSTTTDILIVGAGISGISTLYSLLTRTNKRVILVDSNKIAHGASGHNAGHVVVEFERGFNDIALDYGITQTIEAYKEVNTSWEILDEIYNELELTTPYIKTIGYTGFSTQLDILHAVKEKYTQNKYHLHISSLLISSDYFAHHSIPKKYSHVYQIVDQSKINSLLRSKNNDYLAVLGSQVATINSAALCYEILSQLLKRYPGRVEVFEQTSISSISLHPMFIESTTKNGKIITSENIILCTNGYKNFNIIDYNSNNTYNAIHSRVESIVGFMIGYKCDKTDNLPAALSYKPALISRNYNQTPYFYATKREYSLGTQKTNLICIGGPQISSSLFSSKNSRKSEIEKQLDSQVQSFLESHTTLNSSYYEYVWRGIMGYTNNGIRIVGRDINYPNLLYNIGCNGVGITPALSSSIRISKIINGQKLPKSIFDPY